MLQTLSGTIQSKVKGKAAANGGRKRKYRKARRRFRHGCLAAARRAICGAELYLGHPPLPPGSLVEAAEMTGANTRYVAAALILVKAEASELLEEVKRGRLPLLQAARRVAKVAALVDAFRHADADEKVEFARTVGAEILFDDLVSPAL